MKTEDSELFDWGHWVPPLGFDCIPEDTIGMVYKITNKTNNKFYIGCKQTTRKVTRKPLKGKKRKRISYVESDWRTYCSSSGAISESVSSNGENYHFEILSFHDSKSSMKIEETRLIIEHIYDPMCYNEVVGIRLRVKKK